MECFMTRSGTRDVTLFRGEGHVWPLGKSEAHCYTTTCNSKPNGRFFGRLPPLMMHAFT